MQPKSISLVKVLLYIYYNYSVFYYSLTIITRPLNVWNSHISSYLQPTNINLTFFLSETFHYEASLRYLEVHFREIIFIRIKWTWALNLIITVFHVFQKENRQSCKCGGVCNHDPYISDEEESCYEENFKVSFLGLVVSRRFVIAQFWCGIPYSFIVV